MMKTIMKPTYKSLTEAMLILESRLSEQQQKLAIQKNNQIEVAWQNHKKESRR